MFIDIGDKSNITLRSIDSLVTTPFVKILHEVPYSLQVCK